MSAHLIGFLKARRIVRDSNYFQVVAAVVAFAMVAALLTAVPILLASA